jgi:carboxymethylenebutenolidase
MPEQSALTAEESNLNDLWEEHLRTEFDAHSADEAVATMTANARVHAVPVMLGGDGSQAVHEFYANHFLPQIPPDTEMVPVSQTIGQGRLVEEMIFRFTHTIQMDWMLPGILPTGKRIEVALLVVVQFEGEKLAHEHVYWDQASVLVQLGLLQAAGLPVVGAEGARSVLDRRLRLNELLRRTNRTSRSTQTALHSNRARSSSSELGPNQS